MKTNILAYLLFGVCALMIGIFILLRVLVVMVSALSIIALIGFIVAGFYLLFKAAKKFDENE